jgi:hypothetical protein
VNKCVVWVPNSQTGISLLLGGYDVKELVVAAHPGSRVSFVTAGFNV